MAGDFPCDKCGKNTKKGDGRGFCQPCSDESRDEGGDDNWRDDSKSGCYCKAHIYTCVDCDLWHCKKHICWECVDELEEPVCLTCCEKLDQGHSRRSSRLDKGSAKRRRVEENATKVTRPEPLKEVLTMPIATGSPPRRLLPPSLLASPSPSPSPPFLGNAPKFEDVVVEDKWVACDKCSKWRKVAEHIDVDELPDKWFCYMNSWDKFNSCAVAEEATAAQSSSV